MLGRGDRARPGPGCPRPRLGQGQDRVHLRPAQLVRELDPGEAWRFHREVFRIPAGKRPDIEGVALDERRKIRQLSVGERTLFHLSLILAQRPAVLLIDEVVHGLDPFLREKFLETVIEAMDDLKTAVIMVNHTLSDTSEIPERVLIMDEGRILLDERRDALMAKVKKVAGEATLPSALPVLFETASRVPEGPVHLSLPGGDGGGKMR